MKNLSRAFTLIELLVSVAIFVLMTGLLVAKYGNFNQSVLLTDLAYDVALTIRQAQSYGLSVTSANNASFQYSYGVDFTAVSNDPNFNNKQMILYASPSDPALGTVNTNYNGTSDQPALGDIIVSKFNIKRGAYISETCVKSSESSPTCTGSVTRVDISFKRPDPNAIITVNNSPTAYPYARLTLMGTDGSTRSVVIRKSGQVSVEN